MCKLVTQSRYIFLAPEQGPEICGGLLRVFERMASGERIRYLVDENKRLMTELKDCREKLKRFPNIERLCDERGVCIMKQDAKLILLEQEVGKLKARLMVQEIACGVDDNKKGAKSSKAGASGGIQLTNEWIRPVIRLGNKGSAGNIIYVENKCIGTSGLDVSDVGVQTCNNKMVIVGDKSVDSVKVAVVEVAIQTNVEDLAEVENNENKIVNLKKIQCCKGSQRRRNAADFRGGKDVLPSKLRGEAVINGWTQWRNPGSGGHQTRDFRRVKCFKCRRFGHVVKLCTERGCFACGKFGHVVRNCKEVGGECYNCGGHGHFRMYCPLRSRKCFGCGMVGHLKRDCNMAGGKSFRVRRLPSTSGRIERRQGEVIRVGCQEVGGFYIDDELNVLGESEIVKKEVLQSESLVERLVLDLLEDESDIDKGLDNSSLEERWKWKARKLEFGLRLREKLDQLECGWKSSC